MNYGFGKEFPYISLEDREKIENKYHKKNEPFNPFNRMDYHGYDYDSSTGISDEEIDKGLSELSKKFKSEPECIKKAHLEEFILDSTMIDINENDFFPGLYSWGRLIRKHTVLPEYSKVQKKAAEEYGCDMERELSVTGCAFMSLDFDHSVPDWDSLSELGITGIIERLDMSYKKHKDEGTLTEKQENFYRASKVLYESVLRLIKRLYTCSETKKFPKAEVIRKGLLNISSGAPETTYDMLLLMYLYFMISEGFDHYQVRSLGYGLDATLYPFYKRDIEKGTFTKEELTGFIAYFLLQFSAMGNYWGQPMYLGGTNPDGTTKVNELSHLILDVYDSLGLYNPKIQIKISEKTPKDFTCKLLEMIRSGHTSIVFVNEEVAVKAMMRAGTTYEEALDFVIKGCYEYAIKRDVMGISFNFFNALKPVELIFSDGVDKKHGIKIADGIKLSKIKSFKDFYGAYLKILKVILKKTTDYVNILEKYVADVNPSMLYSGTLPACAAKLTDASDGGIRNVTNMLINGLASAVNALMAVEHLVFDRRYVTLDELKTALESNWEGFGDLRKKAANCPHKYGIGDEKADFYANAIHMFVADFFAGKKNCRGGNTEYEIHSARTFIDFGMATGATPDGRLSGEETSKNASPVQGTDTKGITALINSVTKMDLSLADSGACLDAMLHPSSVQGAEGLYVLYSVLMTYVKKGGAAIHFNIFNAELLKDAQVNPSKYENLQVRVCGWNVLWNNMARDEQDMYIRRAENIAE